MFLRLLVLILVCASSAFAQEGSPFGPQPAPEVEKTVEDSKPTDAEKVKPSVKKLDDTRYQVGDVIFDKKTREIRFPTKVNMTEGLLEFLIVHQNGKIHESLFSTEISPTHLNLAFTLLGYKPSKELYPVPGESGTADFPKVSAEIKAAARVNIEAEWVDDGKTHRLPVNDLIQQEVKATAMPTGPWVYGGSDFDEGKYIPEITGDVVAIFLSASSMINYPGDDNADDTVWIPFPKRVPPAGTPMTIIISPNQKNKPAPKP